MMKKISYIQLIWLALLLTGLQNCDTNLKPIDLIPESRAFESANDVYAAYRIAFRNAPSLIAITSYATDNVHLPSTNNGEGALTYQWAYNPDKDVAAWASLYNGIDNINRSLEGAQKLLNKGAATPSQLDSIRGQLYGLRAYYYWALLKRFSNPQKPDSPGVPLKTEQKIDIFEKPARAPVQKVLHFIASDVSRADSLMKEGGPITLFNKSALTALKARIALWTGEFSQAVSQTSKLIAQYPLATGEEFKKVWTDLSHTGVIMKKSMVKADGTSLIGRTWAFRNGTLLFNPSSGLLSLYSDDDIRKKTYFKIDSEKPEKNEIIKYKGSSAKGLLRKDVKMIRVAEMYFIRAEAQAQLDQLEKAADDLNHIRKARLKPYSAISFSSKTEALEKILESRRREMCFEGQRWYDLKRNHLPIKRAEKDCPTSSGGCTLPPDDPHWLFPIPQAEIFANPNVTQNPGY